MSNELEIFTKCNYCKSEIEGGMIYMQHPKHGIVCERCEPFGGDVISVVELDAEE